MSNVPVRSSKNRPPKNGLDTGWGRKTSHILYSKKIHKKSLLKFLLHYLQRCMIAILCELCLKNSVLKVALSSCDTMV